MASCLGCGNFYTPTNYETDVGICPSCYNIPTGSYANKEWVCGNVSGDFDLKSSEED